MSHSVLVVFGVLIWAMGIVGLYRSQADFLPVDRVSRLWRLFRAMRFTVSGSRGREAVYSMFQVIGGFWVIAGLGLWVIESQVNWAAIPTLLVLVYIAPILLALGFLAGRAK